VLAAAYARHPERFVNGQPQPADLPTAVWINPPTKKTTDPDAPGSTLVASDDVPLDPIRVVDDYSAGLILDRSATLITSPLVSQCH
jgi:hypothetical protein